MLNSLSVLYDYLVLRRPLTVISVLLLIFIVFAYNARNFKLDASADSLLLQNDVDLKVFREVNERYENKDFLFVTFTPNEDLFSQESLTTIAALRKELRKLELVDSVTTLLDVPLVKIVSGKLSEVTENYRTLDNKSVDHELARRELLESPVFRDLIISPDGKTTALIVYLKYFSDYFTLQRKKNQLLIKKDTRGLDQYEELMLRETATQYDVEKTRIDAINHRTIKEIRELIQKYKRTGELHLGGVPMVTDDMITFIKHDLAVFGLGVFAFLVIMLAVIFRQIRWIILPLMSCIYSGLFMMGLLGLVGWRVTVISSNFISLMLILTMSMNIHLIVRYRELYRESPDASQHDLVFKMTKKMIWPCLYTALTTMIGFGSLFISSIKPVIDFGWMMTIGLAVTFLTTFLLFPSILVLLKKKSSTQLYSGEVPFTTMLGNITERYGGTVLTIAVILGIISIAGVTRLKVENSFINYFKDSTEIYQGQKLIDEKLGGTAPLDIILKFDAGLKSMGTENGADAEFDEEMEDLAELFGEIETDKTEAWFTSYKLERIKQVHEYLESLPEVGKVLSLESFLRVAEDLNQGQEFEPFELAVIYKRIPDELKESMINPYISIEHNEARISIRVLDSLKDLRRKELLDNIHHHLTETFGMTPDEFQITGLLVLYNNMLQSLFRSQILTLGVVMLGIALMLFILFRSFILALIGILPNILAAVVILGLMGLANIPLDMMTITIAAITIGIAVDDCIHYIYRFREEFPKTGDYLKTLHYCHANIGRAMFYTSITVIIGFSILVMSNFIPTIYFGLLTTLAMAIALLAALTLLPKLILLWKPFATSSDTFVVGE